MIAIAANSPVLGGGFTGWQSTRQRVWSQLDSARCGPVLGESGDDPASDWARYALRAPVMLVHNPEPTPVTQWVPFADWADGRVLLGDRRPTIADLDYHLTTLFPPVRPRGFLEIRYLDSVPDAIWPAVVFTLATLLDDPAAADIAAEATESVATAWDRAAQVGLGDGDCTPRRSGACGLLRNAPRPASRNPWACSRVRSIRDAARRTTSPTGRFGTGSRTAVTQLAQGEL